MMAVTKSPTKYACSSLQWRNNACDGVSNHRPHDCLLNCLFRRQRKDRSSASLVFVWGIHRWPVNSPHKCPVTRKTIPFDDVNICVLCYPCHSSLWISVIYSYFPGPWISIKMSSYPYRECHSKDHLVVTSSYIQNGISYTYKVVSLYWIISRVPSLALVHNCNCPKDS